jgi:sterol 3beta-glucosyltransferase
MPFAGDQPFWAWRLHQLGAAPKPLSTARPNAKALAAALGYVEQPTVVARSAELGRSMRHESGLATAVAAVTRLLAH